ncbi:response regulator [Phenylobacterium sp. J426]|uniref:response regulator n=1 Tax=Phenylobacterium sp. J426 TaxID=2898439 RepID=UPI002150FDD2|nr:response regulator [Phenylobacterium sp. J426]MCR5876901.1 response regulator [Phenylobacterium sp. J426]
MSPQIQLVGVEVLVLEDDYYLADDARRTLENAGARVIGPFYDPDHAVQAAEARKPTCALVDINLGDGLSFVAAERLQAGGVPIIFVTGYDAEMIPPALQDAPRLQKPIEPHAVLQAVRTVCAEGA